MRLPILVTFFLAVALSGLAAAPGAASERIVSITRANKPVVMRTDTPVPTEPAQLFYVQRSTNRNTVIYAARFDAQGRLDPSNPIAVYWRRYEEEGQIQELSAVQRLLAFGVSVRPLPTEGEFDVRFRAMAGAQVTLRQTGPFKAVMIGSYENERMQLIYGYVEARDDGLIPRVIEARVFGQDENGAFVDVLARP